MGEKKVTIMVLKVDLQCSKCYKKVKKVLCKFPQIQDQTYDEKQNKVIIKVVCCSPEKIRDKICCKGDGSIESIEILPEKEPEKPKPAPAPAPAKPKAPAPEPKPAPEKKPYIPEKPEEPTDPEKRKEPTKSKRSLAPAPPPATCYPLVPNPVEVFCRECYEGHGGGPCYRLGNGQETYYDGYYGRPVYDSWGGGYGCDRAYHRSRCTDYISEENPTACTIM